MAASVFQNFQSSFVAPNSYFRLRSSRLNRDIEKFSASNYTKLNGRYQKLKLLTKSIYSNIHQIKDKLKLESRLTEL